MIKKVDIKEEIAKLEDQIHVRNYDRDGEFVLKVLKHIRDILVIDFGPEPEKFIEMDVACEAWKAVRVLERIYKEENE